MKAVASIEDTPRVVALAIGFAVVMLARAVTAGALDHFDGAELVAYALLGIGLGALPLVLDPGLRGRTGGAAPDPESGHLLRA